MKPLPAILLQTAVHDTLQSWRNRTDSVSYRRRILFQDRAQSLNRGRPLEGARTCEHLVENGARGKNVGAVIGRFSSHLLGRHIADRSHQHAWLGLGLLCECCERVRFLLGEFGETKIQNLGSSV